MYPEKHSLKDINDIILYNIETGEEFMRMTSLKLGTIEYMPNKKMLTLDNVWTYNSFNNMLTFTMNRGEI